MRTLAQLVHAPGTPLQNNLRELWSLLFYLLPEFKLNADPFEHGANLHRGVVQLPLLKKAHHLLRLFMIRRTKQVVEASLPAKIERTVFLPLSTMQIDFYRELLSKHPRLNEVMSQKQLNALLFQVRRDAREVERVRWDSFFSHFLPALDLIPRRVPTRSCARSAITQHSSRSLLLVEPPLRRICSRMVWCTFAPDCAF